MNKTCSNCKHSFYTQDFGFNDFVLRCSEKDCVMVSCVCDKWEERKDCEPYACCYCIYTNRRHCATCSRYPNFRKECVENE